MRNLWILALWLSTAVPAAAEEPLRIGAIFSLSGWGAEGGSSDLNGALLAAEEINAAGGVAGRRLELAVEDNRSDLRDTASAFQKLVKLDKVPALVGPNWAEFSEIAAPLAEQSGVPMITPSGYKDGLFAGKRFVFTLWPPHRVAAKPLADYLIARRHRQVAVLLTENAYLEGVLDAIRTLLEPSPVKLGAPQRFNQGQADFRAVITRLKKSGDDAVLALIVENSDLAVFLKQAREQKLGLQLYTANTVPFDETIRKDPSIAEGLIYFDYLVPGGAAFAERYRSRFGRSPGFASARAYDAVFLIKAAVEKCGAAPQAIRDCLHGADYQGLSGRIRFDRDGVIQGVTGTTRLMHIAGGKLEPM